LNARFLIIVFGVAAAVWSIRRWRLAVQVGLVLVVFEGAIRKWLLPGSQDLVYFAKDVFFLGAYFGYFQHRSALKLRYPQEPLLYAALVLGVVVGLLQILNPQLPNMLVGMLGFKSYFFYIPLLFVVPAVFPDDLALASFLKRYVLLAIPVSLLALAQFFSPSSSVLNTYARAADPGSISTFGSSSYVRATGTFAYITGFTSFLLVITILILLILTTTRWRFRGNVKILAALGASFLGMVSSGSRGPIFLLAMLFPLYWWLGVVREKQGGATLARLVIGLGVLVVVLSSTGDKAITAFGQRASASTDTASRLLAPFLSPRDALLSAGMIGSGIGATHQAASAVTRGIVPYSWVRGNANEAESGRVMLEVGPLGFCMVYLVRILLAVLAFRQVFRLRTVFHRAVAISALLLFLVEIPGGVIFDVTSGVYYWFLAGLLFCVMQLDREAVPAALPAMRATQAAKARHPLARPSPGLPGAPPLAPPIASSRGLR